MEPLSKTLECRKRRRSSVENEIMKKRLQEWRAKKGLPTLSKLQEERENRKLPPKHTTPSHLLKRKSIQMSKSEKKVERTDYLSKQASSYTPGPSSHHDTAINRRRTSSSLQINKQPGRRSLAPSTRMNTPHQISNSVKRNEIAASKNVTSLPSKRHETPSSVVPQQAPIKSHDQSHDLRTQGRKSVWFFSPKMETVESAEACDVDIPTSRTPSITTGSSKNKLGMKERLEQWLIAKGKTPSRFHNFLGYDSSSLHHTPGESFKRRRSGTPHLGRTRRDTPGKGTWGNDEDPVHRTMKECLEMLEEGCPLEDMSAWLDGMVTKVPLIQQCASYWLCRTKIAEKQCGDQSAIECLFEAVEFNPEPVKDILDTLATYRLKLKMNSEECAETRPKSPSVETSAGSPLRHSLCLEVQTPVAHLRFEEEDGNQSPDETDGERPGGDTSHLSIKFSLKETTPYFLRIHQTSGHSPSAPCLLVTPVRRSARLDNKRRSIACLGTQLTRTPAIEDCLDSMREVAATYPTAQLILRPNRALTEEFSEAELKE